MLIYLSWLKSHFVFPFLKETGTVQLQCSFIVGEYLNGFSGADQLSVSVENSVFKNQLGTACIDEFSFYSKGVAIFQRQEMLGACFYDWCCETVFLYIQIGKSVFPPESFAPESSGICFTIWMTSHAVHSSSWKVTAMVAPGWVVFRFCFFFVHSFSLSCFGVAESSQFGVGTHVIRASDFDVKIPQFCNLCKFSRKQLSQICNLFFLIVIAFEWAYTFHLCVVTFQGQLDFAASILAPCNLRAGKHCYAWNY